MRFYYRTKHDFDTTHYIKAYDSCPNHDAFIRELNYWNRVARERNSGEYYVEVPESCVKKLYPPNSFTMRTFYEQEWIGPE